jgi:hypothetical protein
VLYSSDEARTRAQGVVAQLAVLAEVKDGKPGGLSKQSMCVSV